MMFRKYQSPHSTPSSHLLRLPLELRLQIYSYLIPQNRLVDAASPNLRTPKSSFGGGHVLNIRSNGNRGLVGSGQSDANKNNNSILLLSKQISTEALEILYGKNIFKLELDGREERRFRARFVESNRQRITRVVITIARSLPLFGGSYLDEVFWAVFLPQLSSLHIFVTGSESVYVQPWQIRNENFKASIWVTWLSSYLRCLGRHISDGTVVKVDDKGSVQLKELFREYLPEGYREEKWSNTGLN